MKVKGKCLSPSYETPNHDRVAWVQFEDRTGYQTVLVCPEKRSDPDLIATLQNAGSLKVNLFIRAKSVHARAEEELSLNRICIAGAEIESDGIRLIKETKCD